MEEVNDKRRWFVARTRSGQELKVKERLDLLGVENFIPTEVKKNYRGKPKQHPVISCLVFVRAQKTAACDLKTKNSLPVNYIRDCASGTMMFVPDRQMDDFRRVLESSTMEGGLVDQIVNPGEAVRVSAGPLKGVQGQIMEVLGEYYVVVGLSGLLYARARVPKAWLERI